MTEQPQRLTSVSDIIAVTTLPDPTVPVPFERFASLKDSQDMLVRASFWCFLAAWNIEHSGPQHDRALAVEARHDGHTIRAITNELAIRDAVIITQRDLNVLQHEAEDNILRASGALGWLWLALSFLAGVVVTLVAAGIPLWARGALW